MVKKIIFVDIDETILPHGDKILKQEIIDTIKKLEANNVKVVITTGRSLASAKPHLDAINAQSYIVSDGQMVCLEGKIIYEKYVHEDLKNTAIKKLKVNLVPFGLAHPGGVAVQKSFFSKRIFSKIQENFSNVTLEDDASKIQDVFGIWIFTYKWRLNRLEKKGLKHGRIVRYSGNVAYLSLDDESKAHGIKIFLEHLPEKYETYAIGDGINDFEMLSFVDNGIAMGNASDEIKRVAKYETKSISENGFIHAMYEFGLLKK